MYLPKPREKALERGCKLILEKLLGDMGSLLKYYNKKKCDSLALGVFWDQWQWRSQGLNYGEEAKFLWHLKCERQMLPRENVEFLASLERILRRGLKKS